MSSTTIVSINAADPRDSLTLVRNLISTAICMGMDTCEALPLDVLQIMSDPWELS